MAELNLETTMMKNYFGWAGGKTPAAPGDKDELPAAPADVKPGRKK